MSREIRCWQLGYRRVIVKFSGIIELNQHLELLRPWWPQIQLPGGPGLHDTNLNTLSTQTPRDQELLVHIKKIVANQMIKMMAVFSSSLMKSVLNLMRNPKLAHILVLIILYRFHFLYAGTHQRFLSGDVVYYDEEKHEAMAGTM